MGLAIWIRFSIAHELASLNRRMAFWLDEAEMAGWRPARRTTPGGQPLHSELAIELVLTLWLVFHLALRQAEAFTRGLPRLLRLELSVPDHTTLSRRGRGFAERRPRATQNDLVLDSTGLQLFGQRAALGRVRFVRENAPFVETRGLD